jgi:hypothetical protein
MSVDLRNASTFGRISLLVMDDCLIKLEHGYTRDRVRRLMYDAIESVIIWRRVPGVRITVCVVLFLLPGMGLLFANSTVAIVIGIFLLALALGLISWYIYAGKTIIRIVRIGKTDDVIGIFRPGRVRRFRTLFIDGIQRAQDAILAQSAGAEPAAVPVSEPASSAAPIIEPSTEPLAEPPTSEGTVG